MWCRLYGGNISGNVRYRRTGKCKMRYTKLEGKWEFYIQWSVYRVICANKYPRRYNNIQFICIWKLLYMFWVVSPSIIRSSHHCFYSIWHYWDRYNSRQVTASIMPDTVDTVIWAPDDGWRYHPKHVEQFADINRLILLHLVGQLLTQMSI